MLFFIYFDKFFVNGRIKRFIPLNTLENIEFDFIRLVIFTFNLIIKPSSILNEENATIIKQLYDIYSFIQMKTQ